MISYAALILIQIVFVSLFGGVVLYLVVFPAFHLATLPPRRGGLGLCVSILLAGAWCLGSAGAGVILSYTHSQPHLASPPVQAPDALLLVAAVLTLTASGALCGLIARLAAQLPHIVKLTASAGMLIGTLNAALSVQNTSWLPHPYYIIAWFALPLVALYISATIQSTRLSRFRAGNCVACGHEKVGRRACCDACNVPTRHFCYRCRRLADARPGEPCQHCKMAAIAARCWKCGYSWDGVTLPRCPECGVWKPIPVEPAGSVPEATDAACSKPAPVEGD